MPKSSRQRQEFAAKKPYFVAAVFSLALAVFLLSVAEGKIADIRNQRLGDVKSQVDRLSSKDRQLSAARDKSDQLVKNALALGSMAAQHSYWISLLGEVRRILMSCESDLSAQLTQASGSAQPIDEGIWIEEFSPVLPEGSAFDASSMGASAGGSMGGVRAEQRALIRVTRATPAYAAGRGGWARGSGDPSVGHRGD